MGSLKDWFDAKFAGKERLGLYKGRPVLCAELLSRAEQLAQQWQAAGAQKGDLVAVQGDKPFLLAAWYAASSLEAIFCPLPAQFRWPTAPALEADKRMLFAVQGAPCKITQGVFSSWSFLKDLSEPALLFCTSGSLKTNELGPGRWVAYDQKSVLKQIQSHSSYLKPLSHPTRLQLLPLHHAFGLVLDLAIALELGQELLFVDHQELKPGSWSCNWHTSPPDMALTPRLAHLVALKSGNARHGLLHIGGARFSKQLHDSLLDCFETIVEGYGLTECGPGVLMDGKPLECQVRLEPFEGGYGLLQVKSPTLGHWQERAQELFGSWLNTHDLALQQPDGRYQIVGRYARHLKHRDGQWVFLDSLEDRLERTYCLMAISINLDRTGDLKVNLLAQDSSFWPTIQRQLQLHFDLPTRCELVHEQQMLQTAAKALV